MSYDHSFVIMPADDSFPKPYYHAQSSLVTRKFTSRANFQYLLLKSLLIDIFASFLKQLLVEKHLVYLCHYFFKAIRPSMFGCVRAFHPHWLMLWRRMTVTRYSLQGSTLTYSCLPNLLQYEEHNNDERIFEACPSYMMVQVVDSLWKMLIRHKVSICDGFTNISQPNNSSSVVLLLKGQLKNQTDIRVIHLLVSKPPV